MSKNQFAYNWLLKNANFTKDKGKVFSCFSCGGGSTMGYKLAGFDVIGCNEIDKKMFELYQLNHQSKYAYNEPIQTFKNRKDLPEELFELDILDGSPPCSSFSLAGNRDKDWGKKKVFAEGQSEQVLDTLFFDFIDLAKKLQPKVVIAENVKGLLQGKAKEYVKEIYKQFDVANYYCQHFLLDASDMGVPQRRERVFFVCLRRDIAEQFLYYKDMFTRIPKLNLSFNQNKITFAAIQKETERKKISVSDNKYWDNANEIGIYDDRKNNGFKFGYFYKAIPDRVCKTIDTNSRYAISQSKHLLVDDELIEISSFPKDYNFNKQRVQYVLGMSVPPVMIANIVTEIYNQWLNKIK